MAMQPLEAAQRPSTSWLAAGAPICASGNASTWVGFRVLVLVRPVDSRVNVGRWYCLASGARLGVCLLRLLGRKMDLPSSEGSWVLVGYNFTFFC